MNLEKLESLAEVVLDDFSAHGTCVFPLFPQLEAEFKNLMNIAIESLPEYKVLLLISHNKITNTNEAKPIIRHLIRIIKIEKSSKARITEMLIFKSAEDKMKEVALSFRKDDYTSVMQNLNSILELVLKDKLGIPTTITSINTSKIIDILVKYKIEPYIYLIEAKKRVLQIANKMKHQSYAPSKIECINAIKIIEELMSKIRDREIELTEEIKNKIFQDL